MATVRITKRTVDSLKPGELAWDRDVKGFGVRCQRAAKIYVVKTRSRGRQRWFTIGKHGSPWTADKARERAKTILGEIASGKDLARIREADKDRHTVKELCERFIVEYAVEHKKASSVITDKMNIDNHILPLLGKLDVADVSRADIDRFKRALSNGKTAKDEKRGPRARSIVRGGKGVANRSLALLSKMFNLAERWGWRADGSNPCRHVDHYPENRRERFLSEKEFATLADKLTEAESKWAEADALRNKIQEGGGIVAELKFNLRQFEAESESPFTVAAIRLLVFTGARLSEILTLQWSHVDFERAMLMLPDSKTGQKVVYLSAPALQVLADIPRMENNPHVICGDKDGAHLVALQRPWQRIRKRAGLDDVRLHDLRHSFASVAASGGLSLPMIGKLLGHTQAATTERYAHLAADPLRAANEAIGARIAAVMKGDSKGADVVELPKQGA